ncbi:hypothetical protein LTR20_009079 [Exophiala xenobiotica]|nr:hypothetical protein LTR79_005212 [Exophiala xenobiotica]KAK5456662.1 hypothetical protein LTR20_009079 [Exophiala xenobiotica]KAK5473484.1 hypothetical protein LTR26_010203 [Exophiala xenobiotica]KAK5482636.1 hypothetical protein LTR83_009452 [Exophiala xenobiotica]KAK5508491.1 hypothetical protein LTR21_008289 [Exophiala xenobiotica]
MTSRGPEEFGPQFDKIVIDYCRKTLERASVATVSEAPSHQHLDQPPLLPSAVLFPPEITPPIGLRTASPPPTGRYLWSSFREYDYSQESTTSLGSQQDTSTWRHASMLDPNVIGFHLRV